MDFTLPPGESGSQPRRGEFGFSRYAMTKRKKPSPAATASDPPVCRHGRRASMPAHGRVKSFGFRQIRNLHIFSAA